MHIKNLKKNLILGLPLLLASCGTLPEPFYGNPGREGAILSLPPAPVLMVVICFGAMWPILINTADGARLVPTERLDTAKIFGLTPFETLMRVILPSATPMIAAGMRTGLSIAFIMIVVSEMIGSTDGLGYYILQAQRTFAIPEMYGGILLLAILGYLLNTGFVWAEHKVLAWHYGQTARPV